MPAYEVKQPLKRKRGTHLGSRQAVVYAETASEAQKLAAKIDPSREAVVCRLVGFGADWFERGRY